MMKIEAEVSNLISYVMFHNSMPVIEGMSITNNGEGDMCNLSIRVRSEPGFLEERVHRIDKIEPGERYSLKAGGDMQALTSLDPVFLSDMTERINGVVRIEILSDQGEVLTSESYPLSVRAFDEWPGHTASELISAFVTPNAELVASVRSVASDILKEWGKDSALDGYQGNSRTKVLNTVAAVYGALERLNINYVNPPASFEEKGQRIRFPDSVLSMKEGTCIDLSVLFASVLESIGINPMMVFTKGHAFIGAWLVDDTFPEILTFEPSSLTVNVRNGDLCLVECTGFTNGLGMAFEEACKTAMNHLNDANCFVCAVDVKRSRNTVVPMPTRRMVDGRWAIVREERKSQTIAPDKVLLDHSVPLDAPLSKRDQWERKLLDVTSNNALISLRMGKKLLPLLMKDVAKFENHLSNGKEFSVKSKPQEWTGEEEYGKLPFESEAYIKNFEKASTLELEKQLIRTPLTDSETDNQLKGLYRQAKRELEENGSNSLYISLGVLKWFEGGSNGVPRYAPLILVPAEIIRKPQKGYVVRQIDEDVMFNTTLSEMLRLKYDITLPSLDQLPEDESGVDVAGVLQIIRKYIITKKGWDVMEFASIGLFSFKQFVMWKDLNSFADRLEENKVIRSLLNSRLMWEPEPIVEDDDPYDVCLTLPADSSQIKAIKAAGNGKSFVLYGPPGTGKSQTITNMISNALYNNKTVLFVAEKQAALEVVQKRLDQIGIGNHCLELHSNKSEKAKVAKQLKDALNECKSVNPDEYDKNIQTLIRKRDEIDAYVTALHKRLPCGISVYDAISCYEAYTADDLYADDIQIPTAVVSRIDNLDFAALSSSIGDMVNVSELVDVTNPVFRTIGMCDTSMTYNEELATRVFKLNEISKRLLDTRAEIFALNLGVKVSDEELFMIASELADFDVSLISDEGSINRDLRKISLIMEQQSSMLKGLKAGEHMDLCDDREVFNGNLTELGSILEGSEQYAHHIPKMNDSVKVMGKIGVIMGNMHASLTNARRWWKTSAFDYNSRHDLAVKWAEVNNMGFMAKGKAKREFMQSIAPYLINPAYKFEDLANGIAALNTTDSYFKEIKALVTADLLNDIDLMSKDTGVLEKVAKDQADKVATYGWKVAEIATMRQRVIDNKPVFDRFKDEFDSYNDQVATVRKKLDTTEPLASPEEAYRYTTELIPLTDQFSDWGLWNECCKSIYNANLGVVIDCIYEGMDKSRLSDSFFKALYKLIAEYGLKEDLTLRKFNSKSFESSIRTFKEMDNLYMELNRSILRGMLYKRVPPMTMSGTAGTEQNTLHRTIHSARMNESIRSLFLRIPNLLMKLCPCMLMSPLSASQYLSPDMPKFDLIIFDEASQIPTYKAISALARANDVIVVGDPNQLPPTTFFKVQGEGEDDEENLEDMESFLDDCLALPMPYTYLKWHYRSRHESLIEFSNVTFYDKKLYTFPSPNDLEDKVSMKLVDGTYERGKRINRREAEEVVNEILRRARDPILKNYSIGVVALNIAQQELIDDLLHSKAGSSGSLASVLYDGEEPIFIKNLENVQGDERDVILFSIGYGPDQDGRVYNNFGPINKSGGGRRLNVAVSRARREMIVFSSMTSDQIGVGLSTGVRQLKEFLRFAQSRREFEVMEGSRGDLDTSGVVQSISKALEAKGHSTRTNVGSSEFKVDVGVVDPRDPSRYILGIITDGKAYASPNNNSRDRDFARQEILHGLGWRLMTVWTLDWHYRRQATLKAIVSRIKEILNGSSDGPSEDVQRNAPSFTEVSINRVETRFSYKKDYVPAEFEEDPSLGQMSLLITESLLAVAKSILQRESPMAEDRLIGIIHKVHGVTRQDKVKRDFIERQLRSGMPCTTYKGHVTYWDEGQTSQTYEMFKVPSDPENKRKIEHVPFEEVVNAVVASVRECGWIEQASLAPAVMKEIGFGAGSKVKSIIEDAMECAESRGRIAVEDGKYRMSLEP